MPMEMDYYFFWNMNLHGNSTWFWSSFSWKQCEYMFIPITLLQPSGSCVATAGNRFLWPKKTRWPQDSTESPFDRKWSQSEKTVRLEWELNHTHPKQSKDDMDLPAGNFFGGSKHGANMMVICGGFTLIIVHSAVITPVYYNLLP